MMRRTFLEVFFVPIVGILAAIAYACSVDIDFPKENALGNAAITICVALLVGAFIDRDRHPHDDASVRRMTDEIKQANFTALHALATCLAVIMMLSIAIRLTPMHLIVMGIITFLLACLSASWLDNHWLKLGREDSLRVNLQQHMFTPAALFASHVASEAYGTTHIVSGLALLLPMMVQVYLMRFASSTTPVAAVPDVPAVVVEPEARPAS